MTLGLPSSRRLHDRALNPRAEPKVEKFVTTFLIGDKVMQIENDYEKEIYNGDIGFVETIDLDLGEMTIVFDGRQVAYAFGELDQIVTIHKSQGSEYPAVIIPITMQHYMMLQRNLLYTGYWRHPRQAARYPARAKESGGDRIKNVSRRRRWSKLREWLRLI
jgi:exodeoxyribonuclease V alpha subunit